MLDMIFMAAFFAFLAVAMLGHILILTAMVYRVDGLPSRLLRKQPAEAPTPAQGALPGAVCARAAVT